MNRENLLKRLVDRKMASSMKDRAFCICMARKPGIDRERPITSPRPKQ